MWELMGVWGSYGGAGGAMGDSENLCGSHWETG